MKIEIPKEWIERKAKEEVALGADCTAGGPGPTIPTREQWLERCAAVLRDKGGLEPAVAINVAHSQLENCNDDLTENPEEAAQDEMDAWTED